MDTLVLYVGLLAAALIGFAVGVAFVVLPERAAGSSQRSAGRRVYR